jgi:signal peptidase I
VHTSAAVAVAMTSAMALAWAVHRWLGFVTVVESVSMAPTLAPGPRLLARRRRATRPHRRGDVVVVDSVEVGRPVIKRVVGLPGEHNDVGADGRTR